MQKTEKIHQKLCAQHLLQVTNARGLKTASSWDFTGVRSYKIKCKSRSNSQAMYIDILKNSTTLFSNSAKFSFSYRDVTTSTTINEFRQSSSTCQWQSQTSCHSPDFIALLSVFSSQLRASCSVGLENEPALFPKPVSHIIGCKHQGNKNVRTASCSSHWHNDYYTALEVHIQTVLDTHLLKS